MDQVESKFLKIQQHQPFVYASHFWIHGRDKLEKFLDNFNKIHPSVSFTNGYSSKNVAILNPYFKIHDHKIEQIFILKQQIDTSICIVHRHNLIVLCEMKCWFLNMG